MAASAFKKIQAIVRILKRRHPKFTTDEVLTLAGEILKRLEKLDKQT